MRVPPRHPSVLAAVVLAVGLALTGCGGSADSGQAADDPASNSASADASPSPSEDESSTEDSPSEAASSEDEALEVEIEIEDGQVTPSGERVEAEVGQTVRLVVDSDSADELHVHSTPEHSFEVPAGANHRTYTFTLDQPGVVEVELHELGDVVVTIAARP